MQTSRLFVKNLPKHANEDTLKQHFSAKGGEITDVKVLKDETGKSRRTAFIGFRNVQGAVEAKNYFDKTFLHTSKIQVEFAKPIGDPSLERFSKKRTVEEGQVSRGTDETLSTQKVEKDNTAKSKKHDEFMKLIAPKKASEFWDAEEEDPLKDENSSSEKSADESDHENGQQKSAAKTPVTNRLFLRNLPYSSTKDDIMNLFASYGVEEVIFPTDDMNRPKGFAIVKFSSAESASKAMAGMDGKPFQGRLLHIIPAEEERVKFSSSGKRVDFKTEREEERRRNAGSKSDQKSWHSLFIRADAAAGAVARELGISKRELILGGGEDDDAAVRVAMSEAKIVAEGKTFLEEHGVDLEVLESSLRGDPVKHSDTVVLVKNLPETTVEADLRSLFAKQGALERFVMPPSRTMALVCYQKAEFAKKAMSTLAYSRYKAVPLYMQYAPEKVLVRQGASTPAAEAEAETTHTERVASLGEDVVQGQRVLYIKNLEFSVTENELAKHIATVCKTAAQHVSIPKKKGKKGEDLSSGFGFAQFADEAEAVVSARKLNGTELKGHVLEASLSRQGTTAVSTSVSKRTSESAQKNPTATTLPTKIIVRNLAFEATKKDIKKLFEAHAEVKSVRLPRKMDGSTRGFAFVEFSSHQQAKNALQALGPAHLYGRRLVTEFTTDSEAAMQEEEAVDQRKRMRGGV